MDDQEVPEWLQGANLERIENTQQMLAADCVAFVDHISPQPHEHLCREGLYGKLRQMVHRQLGRPPPQIMQRVSAGEWSEDFVQVLIDANESTAADVGGDDQSLAPAMGDQQQQQHWGDLLAYGSFTTRTYLPNSSLDVCIVTNHFSGLYPILCTFQQSIKESMIKNKQSTLNATDVFHTGTNATRSADPLAYFVFEDKLTELTVHVSINKPANYMRSTLLLKALADPQTGALVRALSLIMKHYKLLRGYRSSHGGGGGLSSYGTDMLILNFIDNAPTIAQLKHRGAYPTDMLGEVLIDFLNTYGNNFPYKQVGIMYKQDKFSAFKRPPPPAASARPPALLSLIDPCDPQNDLAARADQYDVMVQGLQQCHSKLTAVVHQAETAGTFVSFSYMSEIMCVHPPTKKLRVKLLKASERYLIDENPYGICAQDGNPFGNTYTKQAVIDKLTVPTHLFSQHALSDHEYHQALQVPYEHIRSSQLATLKLARGIVLPLSEFDTPPIIFRQDQSRSRSHATTQRSQSRQSQQTQRGNNNMRQNTPYQRHTGQQDDLDNKRFPPPSEAGQSRQYDQQHQRHK